MNERNRKGKFIKDFKKRKFNSGITLVALVVTVVVLLILAGVSIGTLFGDNGIITKAQTTVEKTKEAVENEENKLQQLENWLNNEEIIPPPKNKGIKDLKFGDYVEYIDKNNNTLLCIVLYDSSSEYGVQVIPVTNVIDDLRLDPTSEPFVNDELNNLASNDYMNTSFSTKARCVGSSPDFTIELLERADFVTENELCPEIPDSKNLAGFTATANSKLDYKQLSKVKDDLFKGQSCWYVATYLCSKWANFDRYTTTWGIYTIFSNYASPTLIEWRYDNGYNSSGSISATPSTNGFRPVFNLKEDLVISDGMGSDTNPYTFLIN